MLEVSVGNIIGSYPLNLYSPFIFLKINKIFFDLLFEKLYKNGFKRFEYLVEKDIPVGIHQEWYANGQIFSLLTYNDEGQPNGIQKMWFENGKIKANYVVKNGKRFGFLGAKGCVGEMK